MFFTVNFYSEFPNYLVLLLLIPFSITFFLSVATFLT